MGLRWNIQTFFALTQVFLLPMFFLSGALYPLSNLPTWLHVLTRIDPLTYVVDPMRRAVFAHLSISPLVRHTLSPGVTWGSWHVPTPLELAIVARKQSDALKRSGFHDQLDRIAGTKVIRKYVVYAKRRFDD